MDVCKVCGLAPDPDDASKHASCIEAYRSSMTGSDLQTSVTLCSIDLSQEAAELPRVSLDARATFLADDTPHLRPEAAALFKVPIA